MKSQKMCYKKGTKKISSTPKYEFGAQKMFVPPKSDLSQVASSASTGAALAGPYGALAGAAIGLGTMIDNNQQVNYLNKRNSQIDTYNNNFNRSIDPKLQQGQMFGEGTSFLGGDPKKKTAKQDSEASRKQRAERFKKTPVNVDKVINQEAIVLKKNEHGLPEGGQKSKVDVVKPALPKYRASNDEYATGTSNIHIKPENVGKFNATKKATGETTEELTHSSNPITKKRAVFALNASKWNKAEDGLNVGKGKKIIEVEEKELIFQKDPSGKFILREDHKDSPKHSEGGEDTIGLEGDVIFPAKMRSEVMEAYKNGDHKKLEDIRQTLPKDTKSKFQDGGEVGGEEPKKEEKASDHYFYNREDGDNSGIIRYNKGKWYKNPTFQGQGYAEVNNPEQVKYFENKYQGRFVPYQAPAPVVSPTVQSTPPPKYIPKKPISQVSYERYLQKKANESKLAGVPEFETGIQELKANDEAELVGFPEPLKSVILKGSTAKFANGTSSLNIKTDRINPAALTYTDATDLTHIKGNNAFNYPAQSAIGYVPSQNVPDAIGYSNYLVSQENEPSNITPMVNKKMKYKKGTSGIKVPKYEEGVRQFDPTLGGIFPNNSNNSPYSNNQYSNAPNPIPSANPGMFGKTESTINDYSYAPQETPVANSGMFVGSSEGSPLQNAEGGAGTKPTPGPGMNFNLGGVGNALQTGAELAPTLYNTFKGLSKPYKTPRNFYSPEQYQKVDRYAPERKAAQDSYRIEADNLKKNTGGSLGLFLANQAQASNRRFGRMQDINSNLVSDYRATDNANVDLRNSAKQMNLGLTNQYNDLDLQNRAQGNNLLAAGATGASGYLQQRRVDKGLTERDNSLTGLIGTENYDVTKDPNTSKYKIKYKRG